MISRRTLIGRAAAGVAAAVALGTARIANASTRGLEAKTDDLTGERGEQHAASPDEARAHDVEARPQTASASAPWHLVSPLTAGAVLAHEWQLADLGPVQNGACVATLRNARGRAHRVHLCRNDGRPQGILSTRRVDLVVMNEGYGDLPTEESFAQAVARLAHAVAGNEASAPHGLFAELLPHRERVQRFAAAEGPSAEGKLR